VGIRGGFAGLALCDAASINLDAAFEHLDNAGTWLGTSRWQELRDERGRGACLDAVRSLELQALLVIGGDGSAAGARALAADGLPVVFVPSTFDGVVAGTEIAIGTDSAVAYGVAVVEHLRVTGRSLPGRAFVIQTLGGTSGRLADAVASAAQVADVDTLVPERPFDLPTVAARLKARSATGNAIAVMSEAVGDAVHVCEEIAPMINIRVHPTILGHAQRAAPPSQFDRSLGFAAGQAAADLLSRGESAFVALTADGLAVVRPLADTPAVTSSTLRCRS